MEEEGWRQGKDTGHLSSLTHYKLRIFPREIFFAFDGMYLVFLTDFCHSSFYQLEICSSRKLCSVESVSRAHKDKVTGKQVALDANYSVFADCIQYFLLSNSMFASWSVAGAEEGPRQSPPLGNSLYTSAMCKSRLQKIKNINSLLFLTLFRK